MVEDFLQDSFQEGVFLLRGCGERVGLEDAADGGGQTGAGLLGASQLGDRGLASLDAVDDDLLVGGERLRALQEDLRRIDTGLDQLIRAGLLRLQLCLLYTSDAADE